MASVDIPRCRTSPTTACPLNGDYLWIGFKFTGNVAAPMASKITGPIFQTCRWNSQMATSSPGTLASASTKLKGIASCNICRFRAAKSQRHSQTSIDIAQRTCFRVWCLASRNNAPLPRLLRRRITPTTRSSAGSRSTIWATFGPCSPTAPSTQRSGSWRACWRRCSPRWLGRLGADLVSCPIRHYSLRTKCRLYAIPFPKIVRLVIRSSTVLSAFLPIGLLQRGHSYAHRDVRRHQRHESNLQ